MKLQPIQTNFTGGEFSPSLRGRVDVAKYNNAVLRMENFHARIQGGAKTRGGLIFAGSAKADGRLIPFIYSRSLSFQLEFTANTIRFWKTSTRALITSAGLPLEIATPYDLTAAWAINYEQSDDTMFLFHPDFAPRRLQRLDDLNWRLEAAPFVTPPVSENGFQPNFSATLSDVSVGSGRTITAAGASFLSSDVGRDVISGFGYGTITAVASATSATITITRAFSSTALAAGGWTLVASPLGFIYPLAKGPEGLNVTIRGATTRSANVTVSDVNNDNLPDKRGDTKVVTADAAVFVAADVGRRFFADAGVITVTSQTATTLTGTLESDADFLSHSYQSGSWGVTGDVFRAGDVGSVISSDSTGGLYLITAVTDAATVTAQVKRVASALVASAPNAWSINAAAWSDARGYPTSVALFEQRLWVGGTKARPQTIWSSRIGEYLNFQSGLGDSDGFEYTLNTHQRNLIRHLSYTSKLFALTEGLEASFRGGNEKAIGPTNIQKSNESAYGTGAVRPVAIGRELLFVQAAGRKIRALGYDAAADGYSSPDRTVFSEHITQSGITDMSYQAELDSLIYAVRSDGSMAVCAYSIEQDVVGWSRYTTTGSYRSVSVVPVLGYDEAWVLTKRSINGADVYYVEVMGESVNTDACVVASGPLSTTWSGLSHLEGQTVCVKASGVFLGKFVVSGGKVVLPRQVRAVEIGLERPTPTIEMLQPEIAGGTGTHQGSNLSVNRVIVRVLDTPTLAINGQTNDFRRFGSALLDQPPPVYSGDYAETVLSDDLYKPGIIITQPIPYEAQILSVVRKVTVNDT